jgi:hypothetical protein
MSRGPLIDADEDVMMILKHGKASFRNPIQLQSAKPLSKNNFIGEIPETA